MKNTDELLKEIKRISYSLRLSNDLHSKLDKHLEKMRYREYSTISKQRWIIDAIKERLTEEEDLSPEELPNGKYVNIRIDERLYEKIDNQVEKMKVIRKSYSKKQWIVEALYSKLNRELDQQ